MAKNNANRNRGSNAAFAVIAVLLILATVAVGLIGWKTEGFQKSLIPSDNSANSSNNNIDSPITDGDGNIYVPGEVYDMPKKLNITSAALAAAAAEGHTVQITLKVTLLPESAENKEVDWTVEWDNAPNNGALDVTEFITITPQSDGSTIATLTCYKAFDGDTINIVATSRDSGAYGVCKVSFLGAPTEISLDLSQYTQQDGIYNVKSGSNIINIALNNGFNTIGSSYNPDLEVKVEGTGSAVFNVRKNASSGQQTTEKVTLSLNDQLKDFAGNDKGTLASRLLSTDIFDNNRLSVVCSLVENFRQQFYTTGNRMEWVMYEFDSFSNPEPFKFTVTVTDKNANISTSFSFKIVATVTSVTFENDEIQI